RPQQERWSFTTSEVAQPESGDPGIADLELTADRPGAANVDVGCCADAAEEAGGATGREPAGQAVAAVVVEQAELAAIAQVSAPREAGEQDGAEVVARHRIARPRQARADGQLEEGPTDDGVEVLEIEPAGELGLGSREGDAVVVVALESERRTHHQAACIGHLEAGSGGTVQPPARPGLRQAGCAAR